VGDGKLVRQCRLLQFDAVWAGSGKRHTPVTFPVAVRRADRHTVAFLDLDTHVGNVYALVVQPSPDGFSTLCTRGGPACPRRALGSDCKSHLYGAARVDEYGYIRPKTNRAVWQRRLVEFYLVGARPGDEHAQGTVGLRMYGRQRGAVVGVYRQTYTRRRSALGCTRSVPATDSPAVPQLPPPPSAKLTAEAVPARTLTIRAICPLSTTTPTGSVDPSSSTR
jgi:hypothetical protein